MISLSYIKMLSDTVGLSFFGPDLCNFLHYEFSHVWSVAKEINHRCT